MIRRQKNHWKEMPDSGVEGEEENGKKLTKPSFFSKLEI